MDDRLLKAYLWHLRYVWIRRDASGINYLLSSDSRGAVNSQAPSLSLKVLDFCDVCSQANALHEVVIASKAIEIGMNGFPSNVAVRTEVLGFHGIERILKEPMAHLSKQIRVNLFLAPYPAYRDSIVNNKKICLRGEPKIGGRGDEAIPAYKPLANKHKRIDKYQGIPAPTITTSNCSSGAKEPMVTKML